MVIPYIFHIFVLYTGAASVLLIGAGGLGLWGIQWAKAMLPPNTKVFVADITVSHHCRANTRYGNMKRSKKSGFC